jgi:DNA-binding NtrC family response regulator
MISALQLVPENLSPARARRCVCSRPSTAMEAASLQVSGEQDLIPSCCSAEMRRLLDQVRRVALLDTTLLLSGETGTGKSRLARRIHALSPRRAEPFRVVNCGALAATLIESELFGHVRGAFTGADCNRAGKFAEAGRGTLLLDEVDALPLDVQAKLLQAVEDRTFEPVGSNQPQPLEARLIAASNRALDRQVAVRRFRADLYYRLNVIEFQLPPLREQQGLIGPLAQEFLADFAARERRILPTVGADALHALDTYPWPGNIRELRNVMERAIALCPGPEIQIDDLPEALRQTAAPAGSPVKKRVSVQAEFSSGFPIGAEGPSHLFQRAASASPLNCSVGSCRPSPAPTLTQARAASELARITEALQRHSNNRQRAADELGISRVALYKKLLKYGVIRPRDNSHPPALVG